MEQVLEDDSQQMVAVPKVVDLLDSDGVAQHYSTKCGASLQRVNGSMGVGKIDASKPAVVKLDFAVLPEKQRISALRHNGMHSPSKAQRSSKLRTGRWHHTRPPQLLPRQLLSRGHIHHQSSTVTRIPRWSLVDPPLISQIALISRPTPTPRCRLRR